MKSLFPDMDRAAQEERSAAAREIAQRIREEKRQCVAYLRNRNLSWLVNQLLEKGPATEHSLMISAHESEQDFIQGSRRSYDMLCDVYALWRIGKFWRVSRGIHPGSGEESFLYGIRGVHEKP